jgi:hypothetical protein
VKGKVEGLHYGKSCWELMSNAQQAEAIKLRKQKSAQNASLASSQQQEIDALTCTVAEMSSACESSPRSREREHSIPAPARGGAAAADQLPVIAVTAVTLLVLPPVADGQGGSLSARLRGQPQGIFYVMCQVACPLD